jgi:hypothetical protein
MYLIRARRPLGKRVTCLVSHVKIMHACLNEHTSCIWPQYKYQGARPAPHLANFCHSRALGLRHHQCLEHATAYGACPRHRSIASPSTSTATSGAHRRLWPRSTPSTSTASPRGDPRASASSPRHRHRRAAPLHGVPRLIPCAICFVCGGWTPKRFCVGCGAVGFSSRMQAL